MSTGTIIANLRKQANMSQFQLAKVIKISTSTLGMYETDKRKPSIEVLERLANYFNVTTDYLLGRPEKGNSNYTDEDLEEALDRAHSFSGKPLSDHDRKVAKDVLRSLFQD